MPTAVNSTFDIVLWFNDTALDQNEYLQPQKLHRLLFLSQAYFSVAYGGRKLMPAFFVADEMGPIEPNIYKAYAKAIPNIEPDLFLPDEVESFITSIWRRFGNQSADRLTRICKDTVAYKQALRRGHRAQISHDAMQLSFVRADQAPAIDQVVKPKIMRTQSGQPVAVKAWVPGG